MIDKQTFLKPFDGCRIFPDIKDVCKHFTLIDLVLISTKHLLTAAHVSISTCFTAHVHSWTHSVPQTVEFQRMAQILAKAVRFIVSVSARLTLSQYFLQCGPVQIRKLIFQTSFNTPDVISRPRISTSFSRNSIARVLQLCTTDYTTNCPKIKW